MTALLEVRNLTRTFGALRAVSDVSFSVREGELLGLIGPNGAGKSTLYNLIAGAIEPSAGEIVFKGRPVAGWKPYQAARAGVARTFQIPKPYRHLTVAENVALSALLHDRTVAAARESASSKDNHEAGLVASTFRPLASIGGLWSPSNFQATHRRCSLRSAGTRE